MGLQNRRDMADLSGLYNHHDYGEDDDEESLVCSDDMYDETLPPLGMPRLLSPLHASLVKPLAIIGH